jgi:hypothetical protein
MRGLIPGGLFVCGQDLVLREIPSVAAFTVTAAGVRFRAFAILSRPLFSFVIVFIVLTSSFDHRTSLLFFLGMSTPIDGARFLGINPIQVKLRFLQIKSAIHRRSFAVYIALTHLARPKRLGSLPETVRPK